MIQRNWNKNVIYYVGIFATMQLLSISGITFFNIALMIATVTYCLKYLKCMKVDTYFLISIIACVITTFFSSVNNSIGSEFKNAALKGGIIYCLVLMLYLIMNTDPKNAVALVKGFDMSCKITLFWCILQLFFYYVFHVDLNALIFENILKIHNARSDYYNGALIPSGFYYHRAVLIPCFIYLIFSVSKPYLLPIIIITCFTRSTALIMGVMFALILKLFISSAKSVTRRKIDKKTLITSLTILVLFAFAIFIFRNKINELSTYIIMRIVDSSSNKAGNSSVVHFLYYKNLKDILKKLNIVNFMFGTGFGTSGQHYTWFNGQYSNMGAWVVESDYVNILLSQGIIGLFLWLYLLYKIVGFSIKYKYWENIAFVLIVVFVGIMYNIQFMWFVIVELAILTLVKHRIKVFN